MTTYLIRRILLFFPTILGATFVIFMIMAASPSSIIDSLLPPDGEMNPGVRAEREAYIMERYGLDQPYVVQYLRWLNNVSPVGFHTRTRDDPEVRPVLEERRRWRDQQTRELLAGDPGIAYDDLQAELRRRERGQDFSPLPGSIRWDRLPLKRPDLGYSFINGRPSWEMIRERLPLTLMLNLLALPVSLVIAVLTGLWAARSRGGFADWGVGTFLLALSCLPVIWIGILLIGFLGNEQYLRWFPAAGRASADAATMSFLPARTDAGLRPGYLLDTLWHLSLPIVCLSYGIYAYYSKLARASLLETISADYVRTARAKGLPEGAVLFRHAFRNALIPLITVTAAFLPALVSGTIIVESIFSLQGMGQLVWASLMGNDRELFLSTALISLLLQLFGFLLADVAYVVADPRVSYESS